MTKLDRTRTVKLIVAGATAALLAATLVACSKSASPTVETKGELSACSALPDDAAAQILGGKIISVPMSTSANSTMQMCQYVNNNNETAVLLQISPFTGTGEDAATVLKQDAQAAAGVSKNSIIPGKIVPANGLGDGAFFAESTTSPTDRSVQLHFIESGYKMLVQVNNPKDFVSGESTATSLGQKIVENIKNGQAFKSKPNKS